MNRVVGVRFRRADKVCYCDPREFDCRLNSYVIVQMEKGQEMGWVVKEPKDVVHKQPQEPLSPVIRKATSLDVQRRDELKAKEEEALRLAKGMVRELGLPFKMIEAHYTFDGRRAIFAFGSETRVDFRPLIHQLSSALHCKVELKQVGARDEAKLIGGIGRCGMTLCCATWLTQFSTVTVRMAKEQALPISAEGLAGQTIRVFVPPPLVDSVKASCDYDGAITFRAGPAGGVYALVARRAPAMRPTRR